jgi:ABC-2 type transport system ATP-binding protein
VTEDSDRQRQPSALDVPAKIESAPPVVTVDHVTKTFRLHHERNQSLKAAFMRRRRADFEEFLALDDVSVTIAEGTTVGFIGENGSGKSTLLKCIARILRPDTGTIAVEGKVSALLELGAGFHPELSGRENVFLNGAILGLSRSQLDRKFDDIVGFAGLERFIDTPVKNYSSGMYVRLGFSVAINVDPDVLLVDEVLAVGDESFQHKCAEKFADLRAMGKTIVVVSHSLPSVRGLCDSVVWLDKGSVKRQGDAGEVIDAYMGMSYDSRAGDESGIGARWGSGEIEITRIELLDVSHQPTSKVKTGDSLTLRVHFDAREPIARPVFGIGIHRIDGVHLTAPNSREAGVVPDLVEGVGHVDVSFDRLMLLPGTYDVSASIVDYAILHTFDFRQRAFRFDVLPGNPHETFGGVVSLGGRWRIDHVSDTPSG